MLPDLLKTLFSSVLEMLTHLTLYSMLRPVFHMQVSKSNLLFHVNKKNGTPSLHFFFLSKPLTSFLCVCVIFYLDLLFNK